MIKKIFGSTWSISNSVFPVTWFISNPPLFLEGSSEYLFTASSKEISSDCIIPKCHAALSGKYSPDMEDVRAVATAVLRHRIVRNYKAEAEGIKAEDIIEKLLER